MTGPITGVFGSRRILNGQPRSPHRGVDVAAPAGTPVRAMASGEVSLAETGLYFTGGTVIDRLARGQVLGRVGATGRATRPHLHWGVYWFDRAVDPQRLAGPMPSG